MEYCYEYFDCEGKESCSAFNASTHHCWEIENVNCVQHKLARANEIGFTKSEFCELCSYRQQFKEQTLVH